MGCVNCKRARRSRARRKRDGYNPIAPNNTATLASIKVESSDENPNLIPAIRIEVAQEEGNSKNTTEAQTAEDFSKELFQTTDWSASTAGRKTPTPKTPYETPRTGPGPETINSWELMEGLEDDDTLHQHHPSHFQPKLESDSTPPKPIWHQLTESDSALADLDPEIICKLRRAMSQLGPPDISRLKSLERDRTEFTRPGRSATVQERVRAFQEKINRASRKKLLNNNNNNMPRGQIVVYYTSLRGVRKTYEDCCHVRVVFKGYGVKVDEKDVSMDHGFRDELCELLGGGLQSFGGLPRVFVKEKYVGGVEEVKQMHESGELDQLLEGCERVEEEGGGVPCEGCGDVKFMVCNRCSGSCKLFGEDEKVFVTCPDCNENGLVRCPFCCL